MTTKRIGMYRKEGGREGTGRDPRIWGMRNSEIGSLEKPIAAKYCQRGSAQHVEV
jgi:hypothetical protein